MLSASSFSVASVVGSEKPNRSVEYDRARMGLETAGTDEVGVTWGYVSNYSLGYVIPNADASSFCLPIPEEVQLSDSSCGAMMQTCPHCRESAPVAVCEFQTNLGAGVGKTQLYRRLLLACHQCRSVYSLAEGVNDCGRWAGLAFGLTPAIPKLPK